MAQQENSANSLAVERASTVGAATSNSDANRAPDLKALMHGAQALLATVQPSQHDVPIVERTQAQLNRELREFMKGRYGEEQFAQAQLHFAQYGVNLSDADRRLAAIVSQYEVSRSNQICAAGAEPERISGEVDKRVSFENASAIFKRNLEGMLQSVWDSTLRRAEQETVYELANSTQTDWEASARRLLNAIATDSFASSSTRVRDTTANQSLLDVSRGASSITATETRLAEIIRAINNDAVQRATQEGPRMNSNAQASFSILDVLGEAPIAHPRGGGEANAQAAFASRQLADAVVLCRSLLRDLLQNAAVTDGLRDSKGDLLPPETHRTSARFERAFRLVALRTLEENYATYVRACVFADAETLRAAQLGGVPSTRSLVRAFIQIRLRHFLARLPSHAHGASSWASNAGVSAALEDGPFEDGQVESQPVWMVLYVLCRLGAYRDASELARSHFRDTRYADLAAMITELGESRSLSLGNRERVMSMYNAASSKRLSSQMGSSRLETESAASIRDPFKRFLLSLIAAVNLDEQHSDVADTIEDHIWMRLTQIGVLDTADASSRTMSLEAFQTLLSNQLGESYFGASENPLLFFRVLMLTAQFESACAFLARFDHLKALGVHLAIALRLAGLLITADPDVHLALLTPVRGSAVKRLNYARLVLTYAKRFERVDPRCAVEYYFLLRDLQVPTPGQSALVSLFVQTVAELVLETHQFELIVGRIQPGTNVRSPGLLDRFATNATESVIGEIAAHAEQSGRTEDAILLYDLAHDYDSVVELLVRALSLALATACRTSLREREETDSVADASSAERRRVVRLAVEIAQRYSAQAIVTERTLTHTFYILIDLHTFFEQFLAGSYELAYHTISALEILPTTNEQIDMRVAQFRTFADELQCVIPDVLLSCMLLLYRRARALRASLSGASTTVQQAALAHAHASGIVDSVRRIQSEATVLLKFAGSLLPFRLSHDVTSRLDQLEMRITSLLD